MIVRPYSQAAVESGQVRADALISIRASDPQPCSVDPALFGDRILVLQFDDIPVATWTDDRGKSWRGPSVEDLERAVAFGREIRAQLGDDCEIGVHCAQGKSRSTAIALALLADFYGPGKEEAAVKSLMQHDFEEHFACNPGLILMTDALLGRAGALETALVTRCRAFVTWKRYWEQRLGGYTYPEVS